LIEIGEEIKKDKMMIYKMRQKNTPSPYQMKEKKIESF